MAAARAQRTDQKRGQGLPERERRGLETLRGLSGIEALRRFRSVGIVIVIQFGFAEPIVWFERIVRRIGQLAVELE